ncbi:lysophospholipase [Halobacillus karajensis]|uniref:Phospholipase YtpA n=1 Tax=Halobacillus karajensis TaxID=195088 RepID=A0A024P8S8_9BACI|nr:alpha/beta hydrolase [Halobacillus karajensis]CDQ21389.1 Phospholipase YtpA [Halobacillus karajensis]CDQ25539.1 Phospholipase YtpA [Halobacillus karajensis]CDQ25810.1 Phospholipase YtpA [Halobacillus karajensis]SEI13860.1 lysophospholipase [Halobacillus karajensis]
MKKIESENDRATVVLVHGAFEHSGRYQDVIEQLHKDGYSVIYGDLPGQGHSSGKKGHIHSFEDYIHTILKWVEEADPDKKIFLMGHSMGGLAVVRTMETACPNVDAVILSSPALGILRKASLPLEVVSYLLNILIPGLRIKASQNPEYITRNKEKIKAFQQDPLIIDKVSVRWYREFQKATKQAFTDIVCFPDIPLLVMQAEEDHMVKKEKTSEWFDRVPIKKKRYKQWPGMYHEIYNEPEWLDVYEHTKSFIEDYIK